MKTINQLLHRWAELEPGIEDYDGDFVYWRTLPSGSRMKYELSDEDGVHLPNVQYAVQQAVEYDRDWEKVD